MKVTEKIEKTIVKFLDGSTFGYQEFNIQGSEYPAATKAIERLIKKGIIKRASTGLFYKPKQTVFGNLKPKEEELLKPYLFEQKKRVAYITGTALYNRLGLTTQIPKNIKIASRDRRIATKIGNLKVTSVKSYSDIADNNYYLLELLDVLKDFKTIPDSDVGQTINFMIQKLEELTVKELEYTIKLALLYPPRVRAFLGALLTMINPDKNLTVLKKSINPLSTFVFGIAQTQLATINNWNIK